MGWFKQANNNSFIEKIKDILKKHSFTIYLLNYYHIPISDIDENLEIEICDLDEKFSEGNGKVIRIDKKMIDSNFFNKNFHFVIHEFFHWLKRRAEEKFYFNDPEEIQSFVLQMVWQFIRGKTKKEVIKVIYPIIKTHFNDDNIAKNVFDDMIKEAIKLYNIYETGEEFKI